MIIEHQDFLIKLIDDKYHTLNSVDNINSYDASYCQNMAAQINSKHGIKISKDELEISSAIVCSDGGSTTIHPTSFLIKEEIIFICCGRHLYAFDVPSLQLNWAKEFDHDTCLEIYPFEEDFITHGELTISRGNVKGDILWSFSARDIFVNLKGHKDFEIIDGKIKLIDFENYQYILDANGKVISENLI